MAKSIRKFYQHKIHCPSTHSCPFYDLVNFETRATRYKVIGALHAYQQWAIVVVVVYIGGYFREEVDYGLELGVYYTSYSIQWIGLRNGEGW